MVFRSPLIPALLTLLWFAPPAPLSAGDGFTVSPMLREPDGRHRGAYPHAVVRRPRIALVLSGGGARGITQIGVLRVLARHGIPVDCVAATSLGAIVGGLYAAGYTPDELEEMALTTNWDEVLSLTEEEERTDLLMDQKLADDRSFLALRFQGLEPVFPSAVSSGQRLTNFLSEKTLQALYHPNPGFDDLRISFRAVATDLVSGTRVILSEGSLAEALRAASTVPLLFNPIERDSMLLLDGGLVSNIPVDIVRELGYDIVIAVNSTSGLRPESDLDAPWKTADQIMGIMMQLSNRQQIELADVVITPGIGGHLSSDFTRLDTLIMEGERAAEAGLGDIQRLYEARELEMLNEDWNTTPGLPPARQRLTGITVAVEGGVADSLRRRLEEPNVRGWMDADEVGRGVNAIAATCSYRTVRADVANVEGFWRVTYHAVPNPVLTGVRFEGNGLIADADLAAPFDSLLRRPVNHRAVEGAFEDLLRRYRARGLSLARVERSGFDSTTGVLTMKINEGVIDRLQVEGGVRTRDDFVLSEFPLRAGEVFEIGKANTGLTNINSTRLFEYVYLETAFPGSESRLTIRLRERPSQLLRLGVRIDNERNLQGALDLRDENFRGTGGQLGLTLMGGARNQDAVLEFKTTRLFGSNLTFGVSTFTRVIDTYLYSDAPQTSPNRWERVRSGEYRDIRYGAEVTFGSQLERLGTVSAQYSVQRARIKNIENAEDLEDNSLLTLLRVGTVIDTKDSYPFPSSGIGLSMSYEAAARALGSEVQYNALRLQLEDYVGWGSRHTFHPRVTIGFADRTMPLGQQFRFGGREIFFGLNEDDRRGRQMLLANIEYRYRLPLRILFDTYLSFRYDLGSISTEPGEIKLSTFRHGLGAALALDSPVGPVVLAVGRSFYFVRDLPENPLQSGPFLFYFLVGYQL